MGRAASLSGADLAFARDRFRAYYATATLEPPPRFGRREFAAIPFATETMMRRHTSFRSAEEIRRFLADDVPRNVYYSAAYYRDPAHASMAQKEWLGADVIFDLDADHLRGADGLPIAEQFARVKAKTRQLLDEYLFGDLGVDPAATQLVFSGGRGYHIHIRDERFLQLTSAERRELVEYVLGVGAEVRDGAPRRSAPAGSAGWSGRRERGLAALVQRWAEQGVKMSAAELEAAGVPAAVSSSIVRSLTARARSRAAEPDRRWDDLVANVPREQVTTVLRLAVLEVAGETDAPVTTDVHRLIRLPGSLHGGTGFRVVPLEREALDRFDPLRDAPLPDDTVEPIALELLQDVDYRVGAATVAGASRSRIEVSPAGALFLILRGEARLPPGPGP
ncbi:MAG TPA: DNA primase catalytic subunit PriS [Thermoplasmata archaeon]|nr:DNA primase catalytic subunit PriS [Thermoplasmata archaeon]